MSDPGLNVLPAAMSRDDKTMPMLVYGLYLLGLLTGGVSTLIGLIIAYLQRKSCGERACSHYIFQIRTFWLAILWSIAIAALTIVSVPLAFITFGFLNWMAVWSAGGLVCVWYVVRCVVGLGYIAREEAYPRPRAWLI
jgi:uncharacterized membrane protein